MTITFDPSQLSLCMDINKTEGESNLLRKLVIWRCCILYKLRRCHGDYMCIFKESRLCA